MALSREAVKSAGSPTISGRRSLSPRRMMSVVSEDEIEVSALIPKGSKSPQSKVDRKVSTRLLMQASDKPEAILLSKIEGASGSSTAPKLSKQMGWKTSKFFSRTMASGEMIRGLKKLSTSNSDDSDTKDSKKFKNRFSSLRRKSNNESEGSTDQDKGIVCKKEDILSLINEVQRRKSDTPLPELKAMEAAAAANKSESTTDSADSPESKSKDSKATSPSKNKTNISKTLSVPAINALQRKPLTPTVVTVEHVDDDVTTNEDVQESKVQWDDSNFVDPLLLGDAIETFLKELGPAPGAPPAGEKRVSFKRS